MTIADKVERAIVSGILDVILKIIDKNPKKSLLTVLTIAEKLLNGTFPKKYLDKTREAIETGDNVYYTAALNVLKDIDRGLLKKLLLSMGLGAGVKGTKAVRENRVLFILWSVIRD